MFTVRMEQNSVENKNFTAWVQSFITDEQSKEREERKYYYCMNFFRAHLSLTAFERTSKHRMK